MIHDTGSLAAASILALNGFSINFQACLLSVDLNWGYVKVRERGSIV
jgi:hypothetical protein